VEILGATPDVFGAQSGVALVCEENSD